MSNAPSTAVSRTPSASKTYRISLWVVAGLAIAEVAAVAFAIVRDDLGNRDLASRRPAPQSTLTSSTSVPAGFPMIEEMFDTEGWQETPPAPEFERTTEDDQILDPLVRDKVEFARLLREEGDIQTALEQFRSANQQLPGNPTILYELASCYDALDLADEASDIWLEIHQLGLIGRRTFQVCRAQAPRQPGWQRRTAQVANPIEPPSLPEPAGDERRDVDPADGDQGGARGRDRPHRCPAARPVFRPRRWDVPSPAV